MRRSTLMMAAAMAFALAGGAAYGVTFSIDQGPAGSAPPYNDGSLLVYTTQLGATPDAVRQVLVEFPVDALHIGAPVDALVTAEFFGEYWRNATVVGSILFSLDHGDPFPKYIAPDSTEEIRVAWQQLPQQYATKTAIGFNMFLVGDCQTAIEPNLGLGSGVPLQDDDVDALDTMGGRDDLLFFSIDDHISLIPNLPPPAMQTGDIYVRFPSGGVGKAIDGVADLGLRHDGDLGGPFFNYNDDIDAIILVNLDDCDANNIMREVTYINPQTGKEDRQFVDLGDGILFSLDPADDLPYQNAGAGTVHFQPSIPTEYVWLSTYGGFGSLDNLISHFQLGLDVGTDDIDALAMGVYTCYEIPEPGTLFLLGSGALILVGVIRRRHLRD